MQSHAVVKAKEKETARLLNALLGAETIAEVEKLIASFSSDKSRWVPFGGTTGNKGQIKISTDPVRAIVERITNAIDAVVERGIQAAGIIDTLLLTPEERVTLGLTSPREAIQRYVPNADDSYILTSVNPHEHWEQCTVDIFDRGIGMRPEIMPKTILSLSGSNKVSKPYNAGMFGQGGATSIGRVVSNGYVLFVSRAKNAAIGFTVVRYEKPTASDKRGHYTYLVDQEGEILSADIAYRGKDEFTPEQKIVLPTNGSTFPQGTLVRHYGYDLSSYRQQSRNPLSVYRALNTYLFDTLMPLRFMLPEGTGNTLKWHPRTIEGSRRRLDDKAKSKVEWSTSEPIPISLGKGMGYVNLEYWILEAPKEKGQGTSIQPGDFVHPNRPVVFTLNGQTHGEYSLFEVGGKIKPSIPYTSNSLIMHVSLDNLTSAALDNLLSSGREDLVSGKVWDTIRQEVESLIVDDQHLNDIDYKRMETSLTSGHTEVVEDKQLRESIAHVIATMSGESMTRIFGGDPPTTKTPTSHVPREPKVVTPIPSHDPPTFIRFAKHPEDELIFHPGKRKILHVETDAKDALGKKIKIDAGNLEVRWSILEEGHMRVSVQCPEDAKGGSGEIKISLGYLRDELGYVIHRPTAAEIRAIAVEAGKGGTKRGTVAKKVKVEVKGIPHFDIQWTKPGDYNWVSILGLHEGYTEDFAFDFRVKDGVILYCSDAFPAFAKQIAAINGNPGRAAIFKKHYVAQALIYAFRRADEKGASQQQQFAYVDDAARRSIEMEERSCAATSFAVTAMRMLEEEVKKAKTGHALVAA